MRAEKEAACGHEGRADDGKQRQTVLLSALLLMLFIILANSGTLCIAAGVGKQKRKGERVKEEGEKGRGVQAQERRGQTPSKRRHSRGSRGQQCGGRYAWQCCRARSGEGEEQGGRKRSAR
jgi:hypothetical protein